MTDKVIGKYSSALQASVSPSRPVGIGNIQASNGYSMDLVGWFRYCPLDNLFIFLREDGRHGDGGDCGRCSPKEGGDALLGATELRQPCADCGRLLAAAGVELCHSSRNI
jgi:hypothetical protein